MVSKMTEDLTLNMDAYLPLRDVVFNTLREAILKGELKPGERLMELQLAAKLGVSRTPIREAIRMLEQEGLAVTLSSTRYDRDSCFHGKPAAGHITWHTPFSTNVCTLWIIPRNNTCSRLSPSSCTVILTASSCSLLMSGIPARYPRSVTFPCSPGFISIKKSATAVIFK